MKTDLLKATDRPRHMVGRVKQLEQIYRAITDPGDICRVVIIRGDGGLGKTRIIEETIRRLGHKQTLEIYGESLPDDHWLHVLGNVNFCDVQDFTNTESHAREYFLTTLGESNAWNEPIRFDRFKTTNTRWRRLTDLGATHTLIESAAQEAEKAFWEDYYQATQKYRLLISLDTAEQLAVVRSDWLLNEKLLVDDDLLSNTQQWLFKQIRLGKFRNTTFLIAGREKEGKPFFDSLDKAIAEAGDTCEKVIVSLDNLTLEETQLYFQALVSDWRKEYESEVAAEILPVLQDLLNNQEQLRALHYLTGGQPVRLSLYTDLLIEGQRIPDLLLLSLEEIEARLQQDKITLEDARRKIEKEFINLLFRSDGSTRTQILQMLVRTPRGLTPEQLEYVIYSKSETSIDDWESQPDRVEKIRKELESIKTLSIVRSKARQRVGLQDEIYRIYSEGVSETEDSNIRERKARKELYTVLEQFSEHRRTKLRKERSEYVKEDLKRIRLEEPRNILSTRLYIPLIEEQKRIEVAKNLLDAELEHLHYALLLDPEKHYNETYYELVNNQANTYYDAQLGLFQSELWRFLYDPYTIRFVDFKTNIPNKWGETRLEVLRRSAQADDATLWILRLFLRHEYSKAINLEESIRDKISRFDDPKEKHTWNHTLTQSERAYWLEKVRIYSGQNIQEAIKALEQTAANLEALSKEDYQTQVFPELPEKLDEKGFKNHPAYPRLLMDLIITYANLGYGYVNVGQYNKATIAYNQANKVARELLPGRFALQSQTAQLLNNLSRSLVETGHKRSIRICEDALELRKEVGDWLPIALSYNTLALIRNDLEQVYGALEASATALAISRYVEDSRVTGLSLLQVGEALRRLPGSHLNLRVPLEEIYNEAERALTQAHEIFSLSAAKGEVIRLVETYIELGSLYRDWLSYTRDAPAKIHEQRYTSALSYLNKALDLAAENDALAHLKLDALVNLAWTHYYAGKRELAQKSLLEIETNDRLVNPKLLFLQDKKPDLSDQNAGFILKQLGKIMALRGKIAFDEFYERKRRQKEFDPNPLLNQATQMYIRALAYREAFSHRSVTVVYDDLYSSLKLLTSNDMRMFYKCVDSAEDIDTQELREFLLNSFGDFFPSSSQESGNILFPFLNGAL